jgi:excisionase family DNA binding protein
MNTKTFDPVTVLGCSPEEARMLLRGKRVTPGEVESVALAHYNWRGHLHDPKSYWITISQAADLLSVSPRQVRRLLDAGRLPHRTHVSGVRLMRRHQLEEVAPSVVGRFAQH